MIRRRPSQRRRSGYSMVFLMMAVTFMSIMTAQVLPEWTAVSQREKEAELIFRGLQYAEAIRVFQRRFGRYPVRLEELYEVKPRCIRQLYPDPMSEDGNWGLIYAGGPGTRVRGQGPNQPNRPNRPNRPNTPQPNPAEGFSDEDEATPDGQTNQNPRGPGGRRRAVGPITGVVSKASSERTFKVFMDQEAYDQWAFTVDLVSGVASAPDRPPQVPSAKTLGRPFPDGITPLITFTQPNRPNQRNRQGGNNRQQGRQLQNHRRSPFGPAQTQPTQGTGSSGREQN